MSTKPSRHTPSPSPSLSTASKLPKFFQKQGNRDRSKSVNEPAAIPASSSSAASPSPEPPQSSIPIAKTRKANKFLGIKDKDKERDRTQSPETPPLPVDVGEAPVIVEPVNIPRPRTRSERPAASAPDSLHSPSQLYSSTSSTSRITDLPTRLSGWFSHTFSSSSTDIPSLLAYHSTTSPRGKPSALLTAAKHGKGHLDKAMRYLLDSDATPDKSTDPIWLLGVQHPGYEPPLPALPNVVATSVGPVNTTGNNIGLAFRRNNSTSPSSFRSSTSSVASSELSQSTNSSSSKIPNPAANWPPVFYIDFTSRIWLTYRSHFPLPIKDGRLADLSCSDGAGNSELGEGVSAASSPTIVKSRPWNWVAVVSGEKTWTSDSGWGCMLRTGQSLLANALIHMHLGRDWRRPPYPVHTADYATYVQILTWFLDTPTQEAPFSVHRMALAGKELGTDVGQWFGPSVAAGAIKTLVSSFLECGLAVTVASDSTLYQTHVFAASHGDMNVRSPRRRHGTSTTTWGDRPVLLLLGIRLGIEGVNPIYYDTIKLLYTFPQSVGIAGGRPSSSYYFVGSQADNLFYLDPHNTRPAIPLRPPPGDVAAADADGAVSDSERDQGPQKQQQYRKQPKRPSLSSSNPQRVPASPSSTRTGSSNFSYHAPASPSPLQHQFSNTTATAGSSSADTNSSSGGYDHSYINTYSYSHSAQSRSPPPSYHQLDGRWRRSISTSASASGSGSGSQPGSPGVDMMDPRELGVLAHNNDGGGDGDSVPNDSMRRGLDPMQLHYCTAYSAAELKTFHCERVRKMPMSGLDPSMLIGFLCRDEKDWWDFRKRVGNLPRTIFSVQDELPTWPSDDDDMGLESISEPDDMDDEDDDDDDAGVDNEAEEEEEDGEGEMVELDVEEVRREGEEEIDSEKFFDTCSGSASSASAGSRHRHSRPKSDDVDTDDDPVDPVTPGPNSRFDIVIPPSRRGGGEKERGADECHGFEDDEDEGSGDDIEDDWVDPSLPSPTSTSRTRPLPKPPQQQSPPPPPVPTKDHAYPFPSSLPSSPLVSVAPPMPKIKPSSKKSSPTLDSPAKAKKSRKQTPVPVPQVSLLVQQQPKEHYPFPVAPTDDSLGPSPYRGNTKQSPGGNTTEKRMHTARARDGGRTQSGGVKGILPDD